MSHHHGLVRLGMDLGLAVSDYNSQDTDMFDEIIKLSLAYVAKVKQAVGEGQIREDDIADYFALLGASWASIHPRVQNEYSITEAHPPMADPHKIVAMAAAAAASSAKAASAPAPASAPATVVLKGKEEKVAPVTPAAPAAPIAPVAPAAPVAAVVSEAKTVSFSDMAKASSVMVAKAPSVMVAKTPTAPASAPASAPVLAKAAAEVAALAKVTDAFKKAASK